MPSSYLLVFALLFADSDFSSMTLDDLIYENAITAAELAALPVEGGCHLAPQDFWNGTPPKHLRFHPGVFSDTELQACVKLHAALYERLTECVITIQDVPEVDLPHEDWSQSLVSFTSAAVTAIDPSKALRSALRDDGDRLFVGELRGAEAYMWLQAINTGYAGSIASLNKAPRKSAKNSGLPLASPCWCRWDSALPAWSRRASNTAMRGSATKPMCGKPGCARRGGSSSATSGSCR